MNICKGLHERTNCNRGHDYKRSAVIDWEIWDSEQFLNPEKLLTVPDFLVYDSVLLRKAKEARMRKFSRLFLTVALVAMLCSCGGQSNHSPADSDSASVTRTSSVSMNKDDYPVFPDTDAGADPSVPAEQGGKGFSGQDWQTNTSFDLIGDPHAVKGGLYREYIIDFPGTLRMGGPEWNTYVNYMIANMMYETLLTLDPTTTDYIPSLATHWQISPDKMTFRFRLNPNARFSNGEPVTADDVVASWTLMSDKTLQDPALYTKFTKFEMPVAESKYIVRLRARTSDWKNFLNFATLLQIFPASALKNVTGADYVRDFNFKYLPNSGPYIIGASDIQKGRSISLRRRKDYWAEKTRRNAGLNTFDEVRLVVVRDDNLAVEMFKKGDLDFLFMRRSKWWKQDMDFDKVQRGLIQKRKVFNNVPELLSGFAMNTRRAPLDDIRVRQALILLLDRSKLIQKIFFNEYVPVNSYYPGSVYENPSNPKNLYDPQQALKLLSEAGWKERDARGRLTRNGKPLTLEMF